MALFMQSLILRAIGNVLFAGKVVAGNNFVSEERGSWKFFVSLVF